MFAKIIVIKRTGEDGAHFPLVATSCKFGRSTECDIRIQLPSVSREHCKLDIDSDGQAFISNLSELNPIKINGATVADSKPIQHGDVITITDRNFRFEFAPSSKQFPSTRTPKAKSPTKILTPKAKPLTSVKGNSTPKRPLSPRSDNVRRTPKAVHSLRSNNKTPVTVTPKKDDPLDSLLDGFSPATFYRKSTPSKPRQTVSLTSQVLKSMPRGKETPDSAYRPSTRELRKSMSDLGFKSQTRLEENMCLKLPALHRRVSFGPKLSPEHFDKNLPPKTPVKKGAAPMKSFSSATPLLKGKSITHSIQEESSHDIASQSTRKRKCSSPNRLPAKVAKLSTQKDNKGISELSTPPSKKKTPSAAAKKSKGRSPASLFASPNVTQKAETSAHKVESLSCPAPTGKGTRFPASRRASASPVASKTPNKPVGSKNGVAVDDISANKSSSKSVRSSFKAAETPTRGRSVSPIVVKGPVSHQKTPAKSALATEESSTLPPSAKKSPAKSPLSAKKSPAKSPLAAKKSPAGIPLSSKESHLKSPISAKKSHVKSPLSAKKTPSKSPMSAKKSPAKSSPSTTESPAKSRLSAKKTPAKSPMSAKKSPAKSPLSAKKTSAKFPMSAKKTPARSSPFATSPPCSENSLAESFLFAVEDLVQSAMKTPAKSPLSAKKSPAKSPLSAKKSPAESPLSVKKTPAKSPMSAKKMGTAGIFPAKTSEASIIAETASFCSSGNRSAGKRPLDQEDAAPPAKRQRTNAITPSPTGLKPLIKTPKIEVGVISPIGVAKLLETPKDITSASTPSPIGFALMMKTPKVKPAANSASPSLAGLKRLVKTPKVKPAAEPASPSLASLKLAKTPEVKPAAKPASPSPAGLKRLVKTPKVKHVAKSASPSPAGLKQLVKTPKVKSAAKPDSPILAGLKRLVKTPKVNPAGLERLVKTPKIKPASNSASPSPASLRRLVKTPKVKPAAMMVSPSPVSLKRLMKTPKEKKSVTSTSPSPVGLGRLMKSPSSSKKGPSSLIFYEDSTSVQLGCPGDNSVQDTQPANKAKVVSSGTSPKTPIGASPKILQDMKTASIGKQTPRSSSKASKVRKSASPAGVKRLMKTPKSGKKGKIKRAVNMAGITDLFQTPSSEMPAAKKLTKSGKKTLSQIAHMLSPAGKVEAPPASLKKLVALRAIHGKTVTPSLSDMQPFQSVTRASGKPCTPKSAMPQSKAPPTPRSTKKTPGKKLWSDIVKGGIAVAVPVEPQRKASPPQKIVKKSTAPKSAKKKIGRTPKTPRTLARLTAPSTGHADSPDTFVIGTRAFLTRGKTPKPKRKSIVGVTLCDSEVLDNPTQEALYDELPDTPNSPGEMFVSPLSAKDNQDPRHMRCPHSAKSWCIYNRALARGQQPPPHKDNLGTILDRKMAGAMVQVYKRLGDKELLKRCLYSKTQSANKSLHSVIWSRCPKETFASKPKVEVAVLVSAGELNMGAAASQKFLSAQGFSVGEHGKRLVQQRDKVRIANSCRREELTRKDRREKVCLARLEERRQQQLLEGGPAYVPGGF